MSVPSDSMASDSRPPDSCQLRRATTADADAIHAIESCCFPDPWRRATIDTVLNDDKSIAIVALCAGAVVGHILAWVIAGEGEITRVAVLPEYRRRGLGERLLQALCRESAQRRTMQLFLEVRETNRAARLLYEKNGFAVVGLRRNYYANGETAVVMRLDLPVE